MSSCVGFFFLFFFFHSANCRSPGDVDHGLKFGNNYTHGKTVRYFCMPGYALEGEAELTCEDGRWNTDTPKCKGNDYDTPSAKVGVIFCSYK